MTRVVLLTAAAKDAFIGTSNKHNLQLEYNIGAIYRNRQHLLQQPLEVLLTTRNRSTIYSKSGAIYSSSWRCHQHIEKVMPITAGITAGVAIRTASARGATITKSKMSEKLRLKPSVLRQ